MTKNKKLYLNVIEPGSKCLHLNNPINDRAEIERTKEKIAQAIEKDPKKAALLVAAWIRKHKQAFKKKAG